MSLSKLSCIGLVCFAFINILSAQNSKTTLLYQSKFSAHQTHAFEENHGQFHNEKNESIQEIKYLLHDKGMRLAVYQNSLDFIFTKVKSDEKHKLLSPSENQKIKPFDIETNTLKLHFIGANKNSSIHASENIPVFKSHYHNLATTNEDIPLFKKITINNLYPFIDLIIEVRAQGIEYSFLVHPGGNPTNIKMEWQGADHIISQNNQNIYKSKLGEIRESALFSYQGSNEKIKSQFIRKANINTIEVGTYNTKENLTIDPNIEWATYFGDTEPDIIQSISLDQNTNDILLAGFTYSYNNIATSGSFQDTYKDSGDIFIARMNAFGKLKWYTYFGGTNQEYANQINTDKKGNIYITGNTMSASGFSTSGSGKTKYSGGTYFGDAFFAKFNTSGNLKWCYYYGGTDDDCGSSIAADSVGNISITGFTESKTQISTKGAYQANYGGSYDAFIAYFDSNGVMQWASYFGGNNTESASGLNIDNNGDIIFTGYTSSNSGIASKGAYQKNLAGGEDAFVAKFSAVGKLLWSTYFGGIKDEVGLNICSDSIGDLYLVGFTRSNAGISTKTSYQHSYGGGNFDAYLCKFKSSGSLDWSTYYGGSDDDMGFNLYCYQNHICVTGYTLSNNGIATTSAYQTSNAGGYDAFLADFDLKGTLNYASFFGSTLDEEGEAIIMNKYGDIYMAGYTYSDSNIATNGAFQTMIGGGSDGFIAKFGDKCTLTANFKSCPDSLCANSITKYIAANHAGSNYFWKVNGGTILSGQNSDSITVQWGINAGVVRFTETNGKCIDSISKPIYIDQTCVLPGDANNDYQVSMRDFLNLGMAFNNKGFIRPNANLNFLPQFSKNWKDTFITGANFKHADTNGDGMIDFNDTIAILKNYQALNLAARKGTSTHPPLEIKFNVDSAWEGDTVVASIYYGSSAQKVIGTYGLCFNINFNPSLIDTIATRIEKFNSWVAPNGIHAFKQGPQGRLDFASVRINHIDTTGYGEIVKIKFKIFKPIANNEKYFHLKISDNFQLNKQGTYLPVYLINDSIKLIQKVISSVAKEEVNLKSISIYPVPTGDLLTIDLKGINATQFILFNLNGQEVHRTNINSNSKINLSLGNISSGMYILHLVTINGVYTKKIIIEK